MNSYYYLVASLPHLEFKDAPPIKKEVFKEECRKWLSPRDLETLRSAKISASGKDALDTKVVLDWKTFDSELRRLLSEERAGNKITGSDSISSALEAALSEGTPLQKEIKYEKVRWDFLDAASKQHFFDINWLSVYFLKLQILDRLAAFDKDKGEKVFYNLCEVNYEEAIG
ncbi:MAG: DUF2764 family protein [Candidatus Omnitrophica bacterium]|nr:DUF2764 family protein [Candidatus Omnitrophota bacterium]